MVCSYIAIQKNQCFFYMAATHMNVSINHKNTLFANSYFQIDNLKTHSTHFMNVFFKLKKFHRYL